VKIFFAAGMVAVLFSSVCFAPYIGRLKSDDGAVEVLIRSCKVIVERDAHHGMVGDIACDGVAPRLYHGALSYDGSCVAIYGGWNCAFHLHVFCKMQMAHSYGWVAIRPAFKLSYHSCAGLAVTNDEEAARVMALRLIRDGRPTRDVAYEGARPVLILVQKDVAHDRDGSLCDEASILVAATDLLSGEAVRLEDISASSLPSGRRPRSLMNPDDVRERLSRIMPLRAGRVGRSVCLSQPPDNVAPVRREQRRSFR